MSKASINILVLFSATIVLTLGCAPSHSVESDLVNASIEAHGGYETYLNLKDFNYLKITLTPRPDGASQDTLLQAISLPRLDETYLRYHKDNLNYEIHQYGATTELLIEGLSNKDSLLIAEHRRIVDGANFVFFQPFKLKDRKAQLYYQGIIDLPLAEQTIRVHHLKAAFEGSSDTWHFLLDTEDHRVVANAVDHNGKMSLITNDAMQWHQGLLVHKARTSYLSKEDFELIRPQAFYEYEMVSQ